MKNVVIKIEEIDYTKPITFYCEVYGLSPNAIRNRFKRLGILNNFNSTKKDYNLILKEQRVEKFNKDPKKCKECFNPLDYGQRHYNFCSHRCCTTFSQREFPRKISDEQRLARSKIAKKEGFAKNFKAWQTEHKREELSVICETCKKGFLTKNKKRRFCSRDCSYKGKDYSNNGGYRPTAGRGKMGWYKGYYCNSTWELAWIIYQLEQGLEFERNTKGFGYFFEGKEYKFYPDFKLKNQNAYIEIKGWMTPKNEAKIKQFKENLTVLERKDLTPIIKYVTMKYGENYWELYEKPMSTSAK